MSALALHMRGTWSTLVIAALAVVVAPSLLALLLTVAPGLPSPEATAKSALADGWFFGWFLLALITVVVVFARADRSPGRRGRVAGVALALVVTGFAAWAVVLVRLAAE